jgi:hypothetical protein
MNDYFDRIEAHLRTAVERHAARRRPRPGERSSEGQRKARRWRRRRIAALVLAGTLAAGAVVLLGLQGLTGNDGPGGASSAVAAVLGRVAQVAAAQPGTAPAAGEYVLDVYETEGRRLQRGCPMRTFDRSELWIGADGSGFSRSTAYPSKALAGASRKLCLGAAAMLGHEEEVGVSESAWAPHCLDRDRVALDRLPLGVAAMRRALIAEATKADGASMNIRLSNILFGFISNLLGEGIATPQQRADLYRVAGTLPGVELFTGVRDPMGRRGVAMTLKAEGQHIQMIFDPKTSALLAVVVSDRTPSGAVESTWKVYLQPRIVDALPPGSPTKLKPACVAANHYQVDSAQIRPRLWVQRGVPAKP